MFRHERRTGAFVSALFLTLLVLCMEFVPSTMTASAKSVLSGPATVACSQVGFIGVRGSGDPPQGKPYDKNDQFKGMGQVVYGTYTRFKDKMRDKGVVAGEGLKYAAVPFGNSFMQLSVTLGVKTLTNIINASPDECIVLAGYSQGAWVLHDTLDKLPSAAQGKIKAVLAFGDPHFDPQDWGATFFGEAKKNDPRSGGALGAHDFPSWVLRIKNYCKLHDPVCNATASGGLACIKTSTCAHMDYYNDEAIWDQAASWLAGLFTKPTNPSTLNSPERVPCSDHMKAPWIALYDGPNYGGESLCFEGTGWFDLDRYDFWNATYSVNIAANVVFYGGGGSQISYGYGFQTGDLGAWRRRIKAFSIES